MSTSTLKERLNAPGPKRILSLDGGGVRALITLQYLNTIETILRERSGRADFVLADYFDLIGGTSTGSIVATCLALGWKVERIRAMYRDLGSIVFRPRKTLFGPISRVLGPKFSESPLEELLKQEVGEQTLDSPELRTGLILIAKRVDTGSVWVVFNNPDHPYFESNRHLKLWHLIRASTAAPPFFRPTFFEDVGLGEAAAFVDGGMSMHLNPALQMFMAATLDGFGLRWNKGAEQLLLCSVGTGAFMFTGGATDIHGWNNIQLLTTLISQLLRDSSELNQTILQWISQSPTARTIDSQIGSLANDLLPAKPLLTYLRYNLELSHADLEAIGLTLSEDQLKRVREMSNVKEMDLLEQIGKAATKAVDADHFPSCFDID